MGKLVKVLRLMKGLTQRQLSKMSGISQSLISMAEAGRCNLSQDETRTLVGVIIKEDEALSSLIKNDEFFTAITGM